jgi:Ca2+/H+ antiporter, TMEM165/GDT1 family
MVKEGLEMSSGTASVQDEIKEVEQELQEKDFTHPASPSTTAASKNESMEALEAGTAWKPRRRTSVSEMRDRAGNGVLNLLNLLFSPVFVQTFIMTFLGEWGDRSQIATITLAAASGISKLIGVKADRCRFLVCYDGDSDCARMLYCSCCDWRTSPRK